MPKSAWILPVFLIGCATTPEAPSACNGQAGEQFVGQTATSQTATAILRATHSTLLRWAPPGMMLTMDFNPSRVTVRLGPDQKVTQVSCG